MAATEGGFDAFLTLWNGFYVDGTNGPKRLDLKGETGDSFEKEFGSIQIKSYSLDFDVSDAWLGHWRGDVDTGDADEDAKDAILTHDPKFGAISISKVIDNATPTLLDAVCHAARFESAEIWQKRSGADRTKSGSYFWMIELRNVVITSLKWNADEGGLPTETLMLEYRGISVEYHPQSPSGALKPKIESAPFELRGPLKKKETKEVSASQVDSISKDIAKDITNKIISRVEKAINKKIP